MYICVDVVLRYRECDDDAGYGKMGRRRKHRKGIKQPMCNKVMKKRGCILLAIGENVTVRRRVGSGRREFLLKKSDTKYVVYVLG